MITYELVLTAERLGHVAEEISAVPAVGLDIETTSLRPWLGEVRLVQINTGRGIYVIDVFQTKTLGPVADALASEKTIKVVHNAKFEQKWLLFKFGVELWPIFDTFRSSALIHNGRNLGHNLYDLYHRELKVTPEVDDHGGSDWSASLTKQQYDYAAEDVMHLLTLREGLKPQLEKHGLLRIASIEFGAILPESAIELNGFRLDAEKWKKLALDNAVALKKIRAQLDLMLPNPKGQMSLPGMPSGFNYNSPQQVTASFERLGIKTESTDEEHLAMLASKHPVVPKFMEYRKISKRLSSFGTDYLEHIDKVTGRVHTDFWPLTGAGRYASRNPNLQQIPRLVDYRNCFCPGDGKVLVDCDYGQIELRIGAEITGDKTLRAIYLNGEDAHRRTASIVSGVPLEAVTKEQRQAAKPVNFGFLYGLGAERFVIYSQMNYGVTLSLGQAKKFRQRYFEGYPGIAAWHERSLRDGANTQMARTLWGRKRWLDPEKSRNEFLNTPVQGTGADGLKRALRNVYFRLKPFGKKVQMVHMVHDEIVVECDDTPHLIEAVKHEVEQGMIEGIQPMLSHVPVAAEANAGPSWGAVH